MARAKAKKPAAKKKTGGASRSKKSAPTEMVLVGSKVKSAIREKGLNSSGDVLEGLNHLVHWYIDQAAKRAGENKRKTVRAHDFMA